jgi:hypothetical protein
MTILGDVGRLAVVGKGEYVSCAFDHRSPREHHGESGFRVLATLVVMTRSVWSE